jgi:hypothetical protein
MRTFTAEDFERARAAALGGPGKAAVRVGPDRPLAWHPFLGVADVGGGDLPRDWEGFGPLPGSVRYYWHARAYLFRGSGRFAERIAVEAWPRGMRGQAVDLVRRALRDVGDAAGERMTWGESCVHLIRPLTRRELAGVEASAAEIGGGL